MKYCLSTKNNYLDLCSLPELVSYLFDRYTVCIPMYVVEAILYLLRLSPPPLSGGQVVCSAQRAAATGEGLGH